MGIGMSMVAALTSKLRSAWQSLADDTLTRCAGVVLVLLPALYLLGSGIADACASVIAALFLVHCYLRKEWGWWRQGWFICALVLWGYMMVRGQFAQVPEIAWKASLPWIRYPVFAMACAVWLLPRPAIQRAVFRWLQVVIVFLVGDALFQYIVGVDIFGRETFPAFEGGIRLTGPFSSPKVGIVLAWLGLPVLLAALVHFPATKLRQYGVLLFGIAYITAVFLSGERMAFLLIGFGLFLAVLARPKLITRMLIPALCMLALIVGMVWNNPTLLNRQVDSTVHGIQHVQRTPYGMIWSSTWNIIKAHPVFGVGARHFRLACPDPAYGSMDEQDLKLRCNLHPHQFYLEWLSEGGIVALSIVCVMIGCWLRVIYTDFRYHREQGIWLGVVIALLLRIWPLSTSVSLFVGWSAVPLWLLVGWMLSYRAATQHEG
jgi:O-antigen ligase